MDERVKKLRTPEECDIFERNALEKGRADLATQSRLRGIELRAAKWGAQTDAERECVAAVHAYERVLSHKKGKNIKASRTWPMLKKHGIIPAVEIIVTRPDDAAGFVALIEMGLLEYAFESVVLRYPHLFSETAVRKSRERLDAAART